MRDGPGPDIGFEQALIEHEQRHESRYAKLAGFQDHVVIVQIFIELFLCPVELEFDAAAILVDDVEQIIQPPGAIGELGGGEFDAHQCLVFGKSILDIGCFGNRPSSRTSISRRSFSRSDVVECATVAACSRG